jgi:hypothetical protein
VLVGALIDELRLGQIIIPALSTLEMHDRILTQFLSQCKQSYATETENHGPALRATARRYAAIGKALITARDEEQDLFTALQTVMPWERFVASVTEAKTLLQPKTGDYLDGLRTYYPQLRKYAPLLLDTFTFAGAPFSACRTLQPSRRDAQPLLRRSAASRQRLNLIVAAIALWNTVHLDRAVTTMRQQGIAVPEEYLRHLSPLHWGHILLSGDYHWNRQLKMNLEQLRPLPKKAREDGSA